MKTIDGEPGAVVGKHQVFITIPAEEQGGAPVSPETGSEDGAGGVAKFTIPDRYRDGSALTIEVPAEGKLDAQFTLQSP
jgi:hypothetical protein